MRDLRIGDEGRRDRFGETFEQLLGLNLGAVETALDRVAAVLLHALEVDQIDVFAFEAASDSLVMVATSSTPIGRWRCGTPMRRLALAYGGPVVEAFRSDRPFIAGKAAPDLAEVKTPLTDLDAVTYMVCPIRVDGMRLGVIRAASTRANHFSRADLSFLTAVGRWLGLVLDRADMLRRRDAQPRAGTLDDVTLQRLGNLTPRQREVVELISGGLTNQQIAQQLAVGPGTVEGHVQRILSRLGVRSRTQVAALTVGIRLLEPVQSLDGHG